MNHYTMHACQQQPAVQQPYPQRKRAMFSRRQPCAGAPHAFRVLACCASPSGPCSLRCAPLAPFKACKPLQPCPRIRWSRQKGKHQQPPAVMPAMFMSWNAPEFLEGRMIVTLRSGTRRPLRRPDTLESNQTPLQHQNCRTVNESLRVLVACLFSYAGL